MASALGSMTKEEKDEMVRKKMEDMKKKSEEILKRHLQIEADKRNADAYSKAVIERKKNNPTPEVPKEKRVPNRGSSRHQLVKRADSKEVEEKRKQRLSDGDAPPPDPNFNFLSDPLRQNAELLNQSEPERKESGFRHKNNFGGENFQNVKCSIKQQRNYAKEHPMSPPKNKMEMALKMTGKERRDYENWRKERDLIDKERIARQKTSEGTWKREWDNDKLSQMNDSTPNRKPNEFYKTPAQWNEEPEKPGGRGIKGRITFSRGRGNSGRFRNREAEWENESAKTNRFDGDTRNFNSRLNKQSNSSGSFDRGSNSSKSPLYPGWEPKRNFEHFSKPGGFKKWNDRDSGRGCDDPSWRTGMAVPNVSNVQNFLEKNGTAKDVTPADQTSGWDAPSDVVGRDEFWDDVTDTKDHQRKDDIETAEKGIDLGAVENIVIQCSGQNRKIEIDDTSKNERSLEKDGNDEDGWEDVSGEEEEIVEIIEVKDQKNDDLSYERLRTALNEEVRKAEEMLEKTTIQN